MEMCERMRVRQTTRRRRVDCAKLKRGLGGAGVLAACTTSEKSDMQEDLDDTFDNTQVTRTGCCIRSYWMDHGMS